MAKTKQYQIKNLSLLEVSIIQSAITSSIQIIDDTLNHRKVEVELAKAPDSVLKTRALFQRVFNKVKKYQEQLTK